MTDDVTPRDDWSCGKCGASDGFNEDCIQCIMERDLIQNEQAYKEMGEI